MWLFSLNGERREVICVSIISGLKSNKEIVAEVVRPVKAENKMWLMFVQGKRQQNMYAWRI